MDNSFNKNLKQLYRQYNDGTLVVKDQQYDIMRGFQYRQSTPSLVWEICHNMQSTKFTQTIVVDNQIVNADIKILDSCRISILFKIPTMGYVNFVFLDTIPTTTICNCDITPNVTPTPTTTPPQSGGV